MYLRYDYVIYATQGVLQLCRDVFLKVPSTLRPRNFTTQLHFCSSVQGRRLKEREWGKTSARSVCFSTTLVHHENRTFRKRCLNLRNLKTPAFYFSVDVKHFDHENRTFRKRFLNWRNLKMPAFFILAWM